MATPVRFELTHRGVKFHCLTTWLRGNMAVYGRIELPSRPWQGRILADERIDHIILKFKVYLFGTPRRTRTFVTLVNNNQQLYQLSYQRHKTWGRQPSYNLRFRCLWLILPNLPSSSCFSRQHRAVLWRSL